MTEAYDKLVHADFYPHNAELTWVQGIDNVRDSDGQIVDSYPFWLLVQRGTDRIMVTIDGPLRHQISYDVVQEGVISRKFLSIEGAKRHAVSLAMGVISIESKESAVSRNSRKTSRRQKKVAK